MLTLKLNPQPEESAPKIALQLKPQSPFSSLVLKPQIEEEIMTDEEAREAGYYENGEEITIARGFDWQLKIDSLNFILVVNGRNQYYSDLRILLQDLYQHKVKYSLPKHNWDRIAEAFESAYAEIEEVCDRIERVVKYLQSKNGI